MPKDGPEALYWVTGGGVALALLGVIIGLMMALEKREQSCPNGTRFPEGTIDFRCFVHPQAFEGTAVILFSLMLGILIVLTGIIVRALTNGAPPTNQR